MASLKYERLGNVGTNPGNGNSSSILNTSVNSNEVSGSRVHYRVYKQRWFMLAVLCVLNLSNAMAWLTFAAVADYAATFYSTTLEGINWLSVVYMVATIPFGFVATWVLDTYGLRAAAWLTFAPVADYVGAFFGVSLLKVNWLSVIMGVGIPVGVVASWLLDSYGLRVGLLLGGWFNGVGLIIRYLSSLDFIIPSQYSFIAVLIGQSICAVAQPFLLFAPTKLAAQWFPDNHRAIANTIGSTSNPLGLLVAYAVCPVVVTAPKDIPMLLLYFTIPGAVGLVMVTFGVWSGTPPTPPSASAADVHESFIHGIKKIVRNVPFMILTVCFGAGFAIFSTLASIIEEVLCAQGYGDDFSDLCGALMIGCGMVGALLAGLYVDKTKQFEEVAKIGFALTSLSFVVFAVVSHMPNKEAYILASLILFGLFGFGMYPICFELGVECVYPISEGTSAGLMAMSGQVQGILLILVNNWLSTPLTPAQMDIQQCNGTSTPANSTDYSLTMYDASSLYSGTKPQDTQVTVLTYAGYMCLTCILFIIFFHTEYKRLRAEHFSAADRVLNYSSRNVGDQEKSIYS